jgi:hypothetical protein
VATSDSLQIWSIQVFKPIQDKTMCRDNSPFLNAHCYPDNCRPVSMRVVTCRGNQKIQAVNLPSAVVADLLHKFNGPSESQPFSAARAGVNLYFRRSADSLNPPANSRPFLINEFLM